MELMQVTNYCILCEEAGKEIERLRQLDRVNTELIGTMNVREIERENEIKKLLELLKKAYRKHVLNDDTIGWNELGDEIHCVICDVWGDDNYQQWIEEVNHEKDIEKHNTSET